MPNSIEDTVRERGKHLRVAGVPALLEAARALEEGEKEDLALHRERFAEVARLT
jgi:hypothetical protein